MFEIIIILLHYHFLRFKKSKLDIKKEFVHDFVTSRTHVMNIVQNFSIQISDDLVLQTRPYILKKGLDRLLELLCRLVPIYLVPDVKPDVMRQFQVYHRRVGLRQIMLKIFL